RPFYTMQFLEGLTLRKIIDLRLSKGQFFQLKEVEPIFAQVAGALDASHKLGPHSDIKPENVVVLPDLLKVTDFGLGLAIPRPPQDRAGAVRRARRALAPNEPAAPAEAARAGGAFGAAPAVDRRRRRAAASAAPTGGREAAPAGARVGALRRDSAQQQRHSVA